jgi:hypothetical protein
MAETMAGVRGVFKPIFYDLLLSFAYDMKISIVSALIFIDSIVSVHRIYETWEVQRFNFFISASCQAWGRGK